MKAGAATRRTLLTLVIPTLAACAQLPRAELPADAELRTGRLAMSVQDQPSQSFSAAFELRGQPEAGRLTLLNPLGGTLAVLQWQPGRAELATPGQPPRQFVALGAMVEHATGAPIPVAALFDWLDGKATAVPGWEVDLSQVSEGRLRAVRRQPLPGADLRVVLDD